MSSNRIDVTNDSRTLFLLIAEFGCGHIAIDKCAHHFGLSSGEAKKAAARQQLPVPAFRLGSQKSPWLISAEDLAAFIDEQRRQAKIDWSKLHAS